MSLSEEGPRAAFAAWAASEGITKVGFNPVEAAGVTLGRVWGVRNHHLILLDREWGIWQAARANVARGGVHKSQRGVGDTHPEAWDEADTPPPATVEAPAPSVCPKCQGGGIVIIADVPGEGRICGGRCPCGARPYPSAAPPPVGDYGVDPRQTHTGTHPQPWKGVSQPPPAAGEAKWPEIRDSGGRTDFALTPETRECRLCGGPHVGRAHALEDEHGPGKCLPVGGVEADRLVAGREQDERERSIRASERERCARYAKGVDKSTHPSDLADQLLALPENACPLCESTDPKTLLVPCVRMLERTGKVDPWHPQRKPS